VTHATHFTVMFDQLNASDKKKILATKLQNGSVLTCIQVRTSQKAKSQLKVILMERQWLQMKLSNCRALFCSLLKANFCECSVNYIGYSIWNGEAQRQCKFLRNDLKWDFQKHFKTNTKLLNWTDHRIWRGFGCCQICSCFLGS